MLIIYFPVNVMITIFGVELYLIGARDIPNPPQTTANVLLNQNSPLMYEVSNKVGVS